jgi:signal transduction histidine kinase
MNTDAQFVTMNPPLFGYRVNGDLPNYLESMRLMLHDLAQPLSVMAGTVDLLMIESDPKSHRYDDIKHISDQLQLIIDKMNQIRQLARQINSSMEARE